MGARSSDPMNSAVVATQLARFGGRYVRRLAQCAALSERVAQLAFSHPVLFFALATQYGPLEHRQRAVQLAVDGRPLGEICAAIAIPLAFRRIAPESCREALTPARWSPDASRLLAPLIPTTNATAAAWLSGVSFAHQACDEAFAIWLAAQRPLFDHRPVSKAALTALAMFAWYSQHSVLPAGDDPQARWRPDLSLENAVLRTAAWVQQVKLLVELGPEGLADTWLGEGTLAGYRFTPIATPEALYAEARAMHNCVMTYSSRLARDECRLFSMTHGRRPMATIEIAYSSDLGGFRIAQMKGPLNTECPREAVAAAHAWLARQPKGPPVRGRAGGPISEQRLRAYLAPWREAAPGDPRVRGPVILVSLRLGLLDLGTRLGLRLLTSRWDW
jgi:hypothetical protein